MRPDVAYVYVRDLIERITGSRPEPDHDGDLPVHFHGALFFVRIVGPVNPWVQVFSVGVADLEPSPELMAMLNDINSRIHFARAFFVNGQVIIEAEIWADDVTPTNFLYACQNVASATDAFAPAILKAFGGRPLFEESKTDAYEQGELPLGPLSGLRDAEPDEDGLPPSARSAASPYL
ncbi:MAG: hypothetical protein GC156_02595 [Actinomycetales bacterium]|nr:hypothetical protein [Actinomycetales bacterium]